jgi:gamma-glutamyltranspeptidase / glutathione hydrolase
MAPIRRTNAGGDGRRWHGTPQSLTGFHPWLRRGMRLAAPLVLGMLVTGCSLFNSVNHTLFGGGGGPTPGTPGYVKGFLGEVVADEPRAALTGKEVLSAGGNAADAAVAIGLSLAVTLPSRAGLGGGGACIAYANDPHLIAHGYPEAIMFVSPPVRSVAGGDRPAAVPMLARGLFLLHARYGSLPLESLITKAEDLARRGVPASTALTRDLALVAGPLFADPAARAVFSIRGAPLAEGQTLLQPQLAATLAELRVSGIGDLYQGTLARRIQLVSPAAGVPISLADLWNALPSIASPVIVPFGGDQVAFPPTDGGVGAAAALIALNNQPADFQAAWMRSLAAAARWRAGGANLDQLLHGELAAPATTPLYPASTTFATLDSGGNAVVCALTMNNLFGTGRMVPGLGFLAAASPATVNPPLLAPGLAWSNSRHAFHAEAGGSGQAGASLAAAVALSNSLRSGYPMPSLVPDPGRANVISCGRYLPSSDSSCAAAADPREAGLAAGGQ